MEQNSEIIIYTAPDGTTKLQVQLEDETVWLTQDQMAMLFVPVMCFRTVAFDQMWTFSGG